MLRNIAGIVADEEPKTAVSVSGLYNSSDYSSATGNGNSDLSSPLLSGLSEFTFMVWIYRLSSSDIDIYTEYQSTIRPIFFNSLGDFVCSMSNSNGGNTILIINDGIELNEWHHWTVTGSVSNGRVRVFKDGVLLGSAVMTYSNDSSSTAKVMEEDAYLSQLNVYNRELAESEVAEHYVYDFDLLQQGVLGFDAMTTAQKSGLIYSSSYTKDISISGNEFKDKSSNGITLSPQPSLTGQQIYVYTDISDLPTTEPNALPASLPFSLGGEAVSIYNVNSANLNPVSTGTGHRLSVDSADLPNLSSGFSVSIFVELGQYNSTDDYLIGNLPTSFLTGFHLTMGSGGTRFYIGNGSVVTAGIPNTYANQKIMLTGTYDPNDTGVEMKLYVNDVLMTTASTTGATINSGLDLKIGNKDDNQRAISGQINHPTMWTRAITSTEVAERYNSGIPKCYDSLSSSLKVGMFYAPPLGVYNSNDPLLDPASGIITTNINNTPFDGTGFEVEC